ncbi:mechanosensitive ion channel family protein [Marinicella sp. W31]|uniref:mechanosensitive ion channel family protein n=1 Tax=Marinicella sp. W31 TaxID=3023713 RepID=UPI0037569504
MQATENTEQTGSLIDQTQNYMMGLINNPETLIGPAKSLIVAILIFIIGKMIARWLSNLAAKGMEKANSDKTLVGFVRKLIYYLILAAVVIAALGELGIQTTSLLAVMGAAGLAIGLALKDSLSNFASGVMLIMLRPFKVGDVVEIAGSTGKIKEVKIFSTAMVTPDNKEITIPNGQILNDVIVNYTANKVRRVDMAIGVGYDDDLQKARQVMMDTLTAHPLVLEDPAPAIILTDLGDSSVNFAVRPWAKTEDYWTVYNEVLEQLKVNIEAAGCSIPYPQRDVHMHQAS